MTDQARVGDGDVTINLGDGELVMVPTFAAAQLISRMNGGIRGTIDKVVQLDVDTICNVVAIALGYHNNRRAPPDLQEKIWRAGLTDDTGGIVAQVALYLRVLAAGGRMPKETHETPENPQPAN